MSEKLVSILTPCYNTAHLVWRLLDSVLSQTYPFVEMFIIDDGSTDNIRVVIDSYRKRFHSKGYKLNYIYQENQGQSVAVNNGLKFINGEFLVWPDSDDFYASNDAIEKMVCSFDQLPKEFAIVRSLQRYVDEETLEEKTVVKSKEVYPDKSLFEDCLFNRNGFYFGAGAYMVRTEALRKVTDMEIFTNKNAGQNWQILLPLLYTYKCFTIFEILYNVLTRASSHSRNAYVGYFKELDLNAAYEATALGTIRRINEIPDKEKDRLSSLIHLKYILERLSLAYYYRQRNDFKKEYRNLSDNIHCKKNTLLRLKNFAVLSHTEILLDALLRLKHRIS